MYAQGVNRLGDKIVYRLRCYNESTVRYVVSREAAMDGNQLVDLIERMGFSARTYSGRGMYGRSCVGVVLDSAGDAVQFGIALGCYAEGGDLGQEVKRLSCATDSMGRGMIVYFPAIEWPKGRADSEDDDNDE